jgi:RHS repeat-associated protein
MAVFVNRLFLYSIYQRLKLPMASDANGNMGSDKNKGPDTVIYKSLSLPERIEKDGGQASYTYVADGRKLSHTDLGGKVTNYVGPYVYEDGKLVYIITEKGRLVFGGDGSYSYGYNVKDHLGNTRLAYSDLDDDNFVTKDEILQVADYYPFGMRFEPVTELGTDNKYLYNGKELQEDVDWYDYGARMYDAAVSRFHTLDPKAETDNFQTPYCYAANNPIRFIDWMGMAPATDFKNKKGELLYQIDDDENHTVTVAEGKEESFKKEVENLDTKVVIDISAGDYLSQVSAQQQENKGTTVGLATKYMESDKVIVSTSDNSGKVNDIISVCDAPMTTVNQIGVRINGTAGGGFTLAGGITWDDHGNFGFYGAAGASYGGDGSVGMEYVQQQSINPGFNMRDTRRPSADVNAGLFVGDFTTGGDTQRMGIGEKRGLNYKSYGLGLSAGTMGGATATSENTGVLVILKGNR